MTECLHVVVSGRVQGVGFRYATHAEAVRLGLSGWVCNRTDGRVEAHFAGPENALRQMLFWCRNGPRWASVTDVQYEWTTDEADHDNTFEIRG